MSFDILPISGDRHVKADLNKYWIYQYFIVLLYLSRGVSRLKSYMSSLTYIYIYNKQSHTFLNNYMYMYKGLKTLW